MADQAGPEGWARRGGRAVTLFLGKLLIAALAAFAVLFMLGLWLLGVITETLDDWIGDRRDRP